MIEKIVYDFLKSEMNPIPVYMEIPANAPEQFIKIEKTGSKQNDRLMSATIAIQSYDASMFKAAELNEAVKTAMAAITTHSKVFKCTINSDYNFTDTATKRYRYQAVFDIIY